MNRAWLVVAGLVLGLVSGLGVAAVADTTDPDTIVRVDGDAAHGFAVHHYDGSAIHPPTDSEAIAECGEYDRRRARIRCRTRVRVWYRDLAEMQRSLEWALSQ